ncbi:MAG: AmmeMemoRadiSam system radical SAM enzyme [Acidobacteriota bacterium]|jgi:pyruvate formate lyase activating enzyme|nr:AmmeMemoRadiSam system radical SAM enzyme [Acidobacteriota bacterium]
MDGRFVKDGDAAGLTARGDLGVEEAGAIRCLACGHRCLLPEGGRGRCGMRGNRDGELRVPFGYVSGAQCDPVEKKPFYHVRPGALAFSYGTLGCNFRCGYCQNWEISQAPHGRGEAWARVARVEPGELVAAARNHGAELVVSTYNEPLVAGEWNEAVFRRAREAGFLTGYVSNGYATQEALARLLPLVDLFKVDLKTFDEGGYRRLGGSLAPVLETIRGLHRAGVWVEVVTLIVPGFNDAEEGLAPLAEFVASVSPDIPWHVTAFHRDYRMGTARDAAPEDLLRAARLGARAGLRFVYAGNLPGRTGGWEDTRCPGCGMTLVRRRGFHVEADLLERRPHGVAACPGCGVEVPGRW